MAGIFGGQSSSRGGGLQGSMQGPGPRNFAGEQAGAFDPMGVYKDMIGEQKDLYSWKQQQDLDMQNKRDRQQNAFQVAPPDPYQEAMTAARAAADAQSHMSGQKIADAERTRLRLLAQSRSEPNYGQYMGSNAQGFAHMLPAYAMHGIDVMQGRKTGWDQYAGLAQAGGDLGGTGEQWMKNQQKQKEQSGLSGQYGSGGMG